MQIDFAQKGDALLQQISQALQKRLTFNDNIQSTVIDIADSGPADTEFVVAHNLGKVPKHYIANLDKAGVVYDSNKSLWSPTQMSLKCSAANTVLRLLVF